MFLAPIAVVLSPIGPCAGVEGIVCRGFHALHASVLSRSQRT